MADKPTIAFVETSLTDGSFEADLAKRSWALWATAPKRSPLITRICRSPAKTRSIRFRKPRSPYATSWAMRTPCGSSSPSTRRRFRIRCATCSTGCRAVHEG